MRKIIATTIGVTIAIITLAAVLMPVLQDSMATSDTFRNNGNYFMTEWESTSTDTYTLAWDHTDPLKVSVNSETITVGIPQFYMFSLICADNWLVRYETNESGTSVSVSYGGSENYAVISATTTAATDITIVLNGGTATFTVGETVVTRSYTTAYAIDTSGPYVMKKANDAAYMNGDSMIYIVGNSSWYGASARVKISGTIDDGFNIEVVNHNTWTVSDVVTTAPADNKYIDLYKFDKIDFTVNMDPSGTHDLTYSQVIVPYEVTAERAVHFDPAEIGILAAIPIMIIVAILLMAVSIINKGRE